jgi:voltage-gated potassium channel
MKIEEKIIIFGCNPISFEVGFALRGRGYSYLLVDDSIKYKTEAEALGYTLLVGDIYSDSFLEELGIGNGVETIYTFFLEDEKNIFLTLSARFLDEKLEIISLTETHDTISKLEASGSNVVMDPYEISANRMHQILTKPEVVTILDKTFFSNDDLDITEIVIPTNSTYNGMLLSQTQFQEKYSILLLGLVDFELSDSFVFCAEGTKHKIDEGDILVVIGQRDDIKLFKSSLHK